MQSKITKLFQNKYRSQTTRFSGWDYASNGYYFITICVHNHECVFGNVKNGEMILNEMGRIADLYFHDIPNHFSYTKINKHIIMPNHVHGIIQVDRSSDHVVEARHGAPLRKRFFGPLQKHGIPIIINQYKGSVKRWCNQNNIDFLWQSRYHDHIIRDECGLQNIYDYIVNNPLNWKTDELNLNFIPNSTSSPSLPSPQKPPRVERAQGAAR